MCVFGVLLPWMVLLLFIGVVIIHWCCCYSLALLLFVGVVTKVVSILHYMQHVTRHTSHVTHHPAPPFDINALLVQFDASLKGNKSFMEEGGVAVVLHLTGNSAESLRATRLPLNY